MRGISAMYLIACEEEGCQANSKLVDLFWRLDRNEENVSNEACPVAIDLTQNYLGDAGAAAFFRVLAIARWVRRVDARDVGAGPRAMKALCNVITMDVPGARHSYASKTHEEDTDDDDDIFESKENEGQKVNGISAAARASVGPPLLALEMVDLRGSSNYMFAESAQMLIRAFKLRERKLQSFYAAAATASSSSSPSSSSSSSSSAFAKAECSTSTLQVLLDLDDVPNLLARDITDFNARAADTHHARVAAHEHRKQQQWLHAFCNVPARGSSGDAYRQPTGEQLVYRIPQRMPCVLARHKGGEAGDDSAGMFYDVHNAHLVELTTSMNRYMEEYLAAYGCFAGMYSASQRSEHRSTSLRHAADTPPGVTTAAQLCVELGSDTLAFLAYTNAALWGVNTAARAQEGEGNAAGAVRRADLKSTVAEMELSANVGALLRGFYANPFLEEEVVAHRSVVLPRYLARLKQLYYNKAGTGRAVATSTIDINAVDANSEGARAGRVPTIPLTYRDHERLGEMRSLYYRIVASLVSKSMRDLPSMRVFEQRLREIRRLVLEELWDGVTVREWSSRQRAVRRGSATVVKNFTTSSPTTTSAASTQYAMMDSDAAEQLSRTEQEEEAAAEKDTIASYQEDEEDEEEEESMHSSGILRVLCAKAQYLLYNQPQEARAWNAAYLCRSLDEKESRENVGCMKRQSETEKSALSAAAADIDTEEGVPPAYAALIRCECARVACAAKAALCEYKQQRHGEEVRYPLPEAPLLRPCPACCHRALRVLKPFLASSYTHERLRIGRALMAALPLELRLFFVDMIVRSRCRRVEGGDVEGCAFVPRIYDDDGSGLPIPPHHQMMKARGQQQAAAVVERETEADEMMKRDDTCVSVLDYLARVRGDRGRLEDLLAAFEEWYRLRMVESFDVTAPHFVPVPPAMS